MALLTLALAIGAAGFSVGTLAAVAMAASYLPARRATRGDPARSEG